MKVKLLVGYSSGCYRNESVIIDKPEKSEIDDKNIFSVHNSDGEIEYHKLTGKKIYPFYLVASLDLLNLSRESNIFNFNITNDENSDYWEWYDEIANERIDRDWEGDRLIPIPLIDVLEALKKDIEDGVDNDEDLEPEDQIWHKWAINVLESIPGNNNKFVLIYFR